MKKVGGKRRDFSTFVTLTVGQPGAEQQEKEDTAAESSEDAVGDGEEEIEAEKA